MSRIVQNVEKMRWIDSEGRWIHPSLSLERWQKKDENTLGPRGDAHQLPSLSDRRPGRVGLIILPGIVSLFSRIGVKCHIKAHYPNMKMSVNVVNPSRQRKHEEKGE